MVPVYRLETGSREKRLDGITTSLHLTSSEPAWGNPEKRNCVGCHFPSTPGLPSESNGQEVGLLQSSLTPWQHFFFFFLFFNKPVRARLTFFFLFFFFF